ncbi:hypothetical protein RRG08_033353 [Elysia crispata]|uniref:Uncharacterized protein n=1 Tax=Elysia crispata TaxID=231223 RepID=A0AAE0Z8H3_9GAST|nr:hypothetical protein RRG08_033353 [Elysia crispata]
METAISIQDRRILNDDRISVERPFLRDWNLHIRNVSLTDNGVYKCQINTRVVGTKRVELIVHDVGQGGEVLMIHNVTKECADTYECVADNKVPPAISHSFKITIQCVIGNDNDLRNDSPKIQFVSLASTVAISSLLAIGVSQTTNWPDSGLGRGVRGGTTGGNQSSGRNLLTRMHPPLSQKDIFLSIFQLKTLAGKYIPAHNQAVEMTKLTSSIEAVEHSPLELFDHQLTSPPPAG